MSELSYCVREPEGAEVPLLVSIPHCGTEVPEAIASRFASVEVAALPDTDWHLHRLYDFVPRLGARTIHAKYSRYVVDLNRPKDRSAMYPGRSETGIVPTSTFAARPIYAKGHEPDEDEIAERIRLYWEPYHDRLAEELQEFRARFGYALLFDGHSIASEVPRFFDGRLPGLMLGDVDGTSAATQISREVLLVHRQSGLSYQSNSPFKGGYITRCFGRPQEHIHALQLEMSQRLYMDEDPPFTYRPDLAAKLRPTLEATLRAFLDAAKRLVGARR